MESDRTGRPAIRDWALVAVITAVAALLRFWLLGDKSLWGDEINMVRFAIGERDMALSYGNAHGYICLLRAIAALGRSDALFRAPAAVAGIATVPLMYVMGKLVLGRGAGLVGALLLAVSPMHIALSQEVHGYALFALLSVLAFVLVWKAVTDGAWRYWTGSALVVGVSFYIHLYTAFLVCDLLVLFFILALAERRLRRPRDLARVVLGRRPLLATGLALVMVAPIVWQTVWPLALDLARKLGGQPTLDGQFEGEPRWDFSVGLFMRIVKELLVWKVEPQSTFLVLLVLLLIGLIVLLARERWKGALLLLWIGLPILPVAYFSWLSNLSFPSRRFVFVLPACLLAIAGGISSVGEAIRWIVGRATRVKVSAWAVDLVVAGAVATLVASTALHSYYHVFEKQDYRRLARFLEEQVRPGDAVVLWKADELYDYYYTGTVQLTTLFDRTQVTRIARQYEGSERIWYVRPLSVRRRRANLEKIEQWLEKKGALSFRFDPYTMVSFSRRAPLSEAAERAERESILAAAIDLKPGRWYLHLDLATEYRRQGRLGKARRELTIAHELRGR